MNDDGEDLGEELIPTLADGMDRILEQWSRFQVSRILRRTLPLVTLFIETFAPGQNDFLNTQKGVEDFFMACRTSGYMAFTHFGVQEILSRTACICSEGMNQQPQAPELRTLLHLPFPRVSVADEVNRLTSEEPDEERVPCAECMTQFSRRQTTRFLELSRILIVVVNRQMWLPRVRRMIKNNAPVVLGGPLLIPGVDQLHEYRPISGIFKTGFSSLLSQSIFIPLRN